MTATGVKQGSSRVRGERQKRRDKAGEEGKLESLRSMTKPGVLLRDKYSVQVGGFGDSTFPNWHFHVSCWRRASPQAAVRGPNGANAENPTKRKRTCQNRVNIGRIQSRQKKILDDGGGSVRKKWAREERLCLCATKSVVSMTCRLQAIPTVETILNQPTRSLGSGSIEIIVERPGTCAIEESRFCY